MASIPEDFMIPLIETATLKDGDSLVVKIPKCYNDRQIHDFLHSIHLFREEKWNHGGVRISVLIIPEDIKLAVLSKETVEYKIAEEQVKGNNGRMIFVGDENDG